MVAESHFASKTQEWCEGFWTSTNRLEHHEHWKAPKRNETLTVNELLQQLSRDVVTKDSVSKDLVSKDTSTKELVKPVATKEVAQVTKGRSGGSAQVKVNRRELQMQSSDMLEGQEVLLRSR